MRAAAQQAVSKATARIEQQQMLLDALGTAPKEGEPPEQPGIAEQREKYAEDITFYGARVSQAELATARADALIAAISDLSRAQLLQDLSTANPSPLTPATVSRALPDLYQASVTLARTPVDWWEDLSAELRSSVLFFRIPAFLVVAFLVGWGIRYVAVRFLGRDPEVADPTYAPSGWRGCRCGIARHFTGNDPDRHPRPHNQRGGGDYGTVRHRAGCDL